MCVYADNVIHLCIPTCLHTLSMIVVSIIIAMITSDNHLMAGFIYARVMHACSRFRVCISYIYNIFDQVPFACSGLSVKFLKLVETKLGFACLLLLILIPLALFIPIL